MNIRTLVILTLFGPSIVFAADEAAVPSLNQAVSLQDVSYSFDQAKLAAAKNSFHFLRSYIDYYYLLYKANAPLLPTIAQTEPFAGWCVGDAHPENFGALLQNDGTSLFTMNDFDDSGPCPIGLDLFRLMVSSSLYAPDTDLAGMLQAYQAGINNQSYQVPKGVRQLLDESQKKGLAPANSKVKNQLIVRDSQTAEATSDERDALTAAIRSYPADVLPATARILDMVATSKVGGGSGGLPRFEVLLNNNDLLLHLEFKAEIVPGIYPVATAPIPALKSRMSAALAYSQGATASSLYSVVQIGGRDMLIRPRFGGNNGVSLDKQSSKDNAEIIRYEAYALGKIHRHSLKNVEAWTAQLGRLPVKGWQQDVTSMTQFFDQKFRALKGPPLSD